MVRIEGVEVGRSLWTLLPRRRPLYDCGDCPKRKPVWISRRNVGRCCLLLHLRPRCRRLSRQLITVRSVCFARCIRQIFVHTHRRPSRADHGGIRQKGHRFREINNFLRLLLAFPCAPNRSCRLTKNVDLKIWIPSLDGVFRQKLCMYADR